MNQKFKFQEKCKIVPLIVRKPIAVIKQRLFEKYQHSQNYYYIRDINEILSDAATRVVVRYKDWLTLDEEDEYLKRSYQLQEYPQKIVLLTEYYKFHTDIARMFQEPVATMLNKYYDKKRKYDYYRIAKLIEEENKKNPQKPPKGIVGERPSPVNSQESVQQEEEIPKKNLRDTQILKELSWLNKKERPSAKVYDISQTLNEICKNIGNIGDQSSLSLIQNKKEKASLDNFLLYIGTQVSKNSTASPTYRHQPQEQLIQKLIQQQRAKMQEKDQKSYSMHKKIDVKYSIGSREKNYNFVKEQLNNLSKKSNRQASTDIVQSATKLDCKPQDVSKPKSKTTVTSNQQKFSKVIRDVNQNNSPTPSMHKISICSTHVKTHQPTLPGNANIHSLAKLLIEDSINDQQIKFKNGAITHRPVSGTQNFFASNSNRNSPSINYKKQVQQSGEQFKLNKAKSPSLANPGLLAKQIANKAIIQKKQAASNNHMRQISNQEKSHDHLDSLKTSFKQQLTDLKGKMHKKNLSDGRAISQKESQQEVGCLTDRHEKDRQHFPNSLKHKSSPDPSQTRRLHSEKQETISNNMRGIMIQQIIKHLAKQNQQYQSKQDLRSLGKGLTKNF